MSNEKPQKPVPKGTTKPSGTKKLPEVSQTLTEFNETSSTETFVIETVNKPKK